MKKPIGEQKGVLVMTGHDHRGALLHALDYLAEVAEPKQPGNARDACDIDLAWVRGFGEYGGVMLRFNTNASSFKKHVENPLRLAALERKVVPRDSKGGKRDKMHIRIFPVDEEWDVDPRKTHRTYTLEHVNQDDAESFDRFFAILAADPNIDIAEYDRVQAVGGGVAERIRVFDLAGRGAAWLDHQVKNVANTLCMKVDQAARGESLRSELDTSAIARRAGITGHWPKDFHTFVAATLTPESAIESRLPGGLLYVRVHCPDERGLFSDLHRFIRFHLRTSAFPQSRKVVRSCGRGIGGQWIQLIAIEGVESEAPALEAAIERYLEKRHEQAPKPKHGETRGNIRGGKRAAAIPLKLWATHQAKVDYSTMPPAEVSFQPSRQGLQTVYFDAAENRPGILRDIVERVSSIPNANVGVYHLGARRKTLLDDPSQSERFACAMGFVAEKEALPDIREAVKSVVGDLCTKSPIFNPS